MENIKTNKVNPTTASWMKKKTHVEIKTVKMCSLKQGYFKAELLLLKNNDISVFRNRLYFIMSRFLSQTRIKYSVYSFGDKILMN